MANKFIKGLTEKLTMLVDDWFVIQPDLEESTAYKIKRSNVPTNLTDGSGTTANGNAVDLGGDVTSDVSILDTGGVRNFLLQFSGGASSAAMEIGGFINASQARILLKSTRAGRTSSLALQEAITSLEYNRDGVGKRSIYFDDSGAFYYDTNSNSPGLQGFIDFSSDYVDKSYVQKVYVTTNFLSITETADQEVVSNVEFLGQATANNDTIKTFTATPTFDFNSGNDQQMTLTGNVTTFATSNELGSANYKVYLINDGTAGRTVASPTGWTADLSSETHSTLANAVNLYQFYTRPDGTKYYNIHLVV